MIYVLTTDLKTSRTLCNITLRLKYKREMQEKRYLKQKEQGIFTIYRHYLCYLSIVLAYCRIKKTHYFIGEERSYLHKTHGLKNGADY